MCDIMLWLSTTFSMKIGLHQPAPFHARRSQASLKKRFPIWELLRYICLTCLNSVLEQVLWQLQWYWQAVPGASAKFHLILIHNQEFPLKSKLYRWRSWPRVGWIVAAHWWYTSSLFSPPGKGSGKDIWFWHVALLHATGKHTQMATGIRDIGWSPWL